VTTAATFYAFLTTDFTGLYQMGLIVGTGILFCLLAVLLLVPAMIGWSEEHHRRRESEPRLHIFAFGIEHVTRQAMRWPRVTLAVSLAVSLAAVAAAPGLRFDDSVEALRPRATAASWRSRPSTSTSAPASTTCRWWSERRRSTRRWRWPSAPQRARGA